MGNFRGDWTGGGNIEVLLRDEGEGALSFRFGDVERETQSIVDRQRKI